MTDQKTPALMRLADAIDNLPDAKRKRVVEMAEAGKDRQTAPPMRLTLEKDVLKIGFEGVHPEIGTLLQMADIGSTDGDFHFGIVGQIANLGSHRRNVDENSANFHFAIIRAVKPRDELEVMLAAQMGAVHSATMLMARKLNHIDTISQQDSAERTLNKLARTYAMQMEALKRYRTSGQQKVTVEHVTVNAGGQAIVGAVEAGGGGSK